MAVNETYKARLDSKGNKILDENNMPLMDLVHSEVVPDVEEIQPPLVDLSNIDISSLTDEQILQLKQRIENL